MTRPQIDVHAVATKVRQVFREVVMNHRWSGWPGAYCLDCGCEDPIELALTDDDGTDDDGLLTDGALNRYKDHPGMNPCVEPGSDRHNPYVK